MLPCLSPSILNECFVFYFFFLPSAHNCLSSFFSCYISRLSLEETSFWWAHLLLFFLLVLFFLFLLLFVLHKQDPRHSPCNLWSFLFTNYESPRKIRKERGRLGVAGQGTSLGSFTHEPPAMIHQIYRVFFFFRPPSFSLDICIYVAITKEIFLQLAITPSWGCVTRRSLFFAVIFVYYPWEKWWTSRAPSWFFFPSLVLCFSKLLSLSTFLSFCLCVYLYRVLCLLPSSPCLLLLCWFSLLFFLFFRSLSYALDVSLPWMDIYWTVMWYLPFWLPFPSKLILLSKHLAR